MYKYTLHCVHCVYVCGHEQRTANRNRSMHETFAGGQAGTPAECLSAARTLGQPQPEQQQKAGARPGTRDLSTDCNPAEPHPKADTQPQRGTKGGGPSTLKHVAGGSGTLLTQYALTHSHQ